MLRPLPLDALTAAFVYDETARRFLLRAKSAGRRELLVPFGRQLAAAVRSSGTAQGMDAVVAVPSSPFARLKRGFDPAATIAKELAAELQIPFDRAGLVRRVRPGGGPAKSLGASARRAAVSRAFVARPAAARTVLLVDDVLTTGATASACARALRGAGATTVRAAVWARTL